MRMWITIFWDNSKLKDKHPICKIDGTPLVLASKEDGTFYNDVFLKGVMFMK